MAIRGFSVGGKKSLIKANCENLPDLVFITGGNGVGKSSLLSLLRGPAPGYSFSGESIIHKEDGTKVLYIGANRPWQKVVVTKGNTFDRAKTYSKRLESFQTEAMSGHGAQYRDIDSSDDIFGHLKLEIAGIVEKYRTKLQIIHQENGEVARNTVPEPFEPFREMLRQLLPHLMFDKVDDSNKNDIKILFRSAFGRETNSFDIDYLSSGEKSIISILFPIIEHKIEKNLGLNNDDSPRSYLLDEPELHIHPSLQSDLVSYLRQLTSTDNIQFICVTHSQSIIEAAQQGELFVVSPWESSSEGNQFSILADTPERLVTIKSLVGSAYAYTRNRPIIFIEGEFPEDTNKSTDLSLLETIIPKIRSYVLVPSKGKTQAISAAKNLRRAALEQEHPVVAYALVDGDYDENSPPWVFPWPVCMIENLLLDYRAIAKVLNPYVSKGALGNAEDIKNAIKDILNNMRNEEIKRRIKSFIGYSIIRPEVIYDDNKFKMDINSDVSKGITGMEKKFNENINDISRIVDSELSSEKAVLRFHGKTIFSKFFKEHVEKFFPKKENFVLAVAQNISEYGSSFKEVNSIVDKINNYFPPKIYELIKSDTIKSACSNNDVDYDKLLSWANVRSKEGRSDDVESLKYEKDLVKLLQNLKSCSDREFYQEFRESVMDVIFL